MQRFFNKASISCCFGICFLNSDNLSCGGINKWAGVYISGRTSLIVFTTCFSSYFCLIVSGLSILSNFFNGFSLLVSAVIGISCKALTYWRSLILATAVTLLVFFVIFGGSYLSTGLCFVCLSLLHLLFRWFKFTLKPPYSIAHGKLRLAIWDTSFWTFRLKFGHKGP